MLLLASRSYPSHSLTCSILAFKHLEVRIARLPAPFIKPAVFACTHSQPINSFTAAVRLYRACVASADACVMSEDLSVCSEAERTIQRLNPPTLSPSVVFYSFLSDEPGRLRNSNLFKPLESDSTRGFQVRFQLLHYCAKKPQKTKKIVQTNYSLLSSFLSVSA